VYAHDSGREPEGGCGKTITSINVSAFLAHEQRRVLLVDMDPQGHATLDFLPRLIRRRDHVRLFVQRAAGQPTVLRDVIRTVARTSMWLRRYSVECHPDRLAGLAGRENILAARSPA